MENSAGSHTQMALNEPDSIQWTAEARLHYRIRLGERGDGRYLNDWHGQERTTPPARWSKPVSHPDLPVVIGRAYTLTMDAHVPGHAVSPETGLYLEGKLIARATVGDSLLSVKLPPSTTDKIRLELRCTGWVPRQ